MVKSGKALKFGEEVVMVGYSDHLEILAPDIPDMSLWGKFAADALWPSLEPDAESFTMGNGTWEVSLDFLTGKSTFEVSPTSTGLEDVWVPRFFEEMAKRLHELHHERKSNGRD